MRFLAFEGLDGSGKTTLIKGLEQHLTRSSLEVLVTREPGGTSLGDDIRQILLRTEGEAPVPRAEALLYQASRAQHVERKIRPALAQNQWVLCDRFAASSLAFQAGGRTLKASDINWLNSFSTDNLQPDLYILLDLSVNESVKRLKTRGEKADRFEAEAVEFHEKVRQAYLQMASENQAHWLVLSASEKPQDLLSQVVDDLKRRRWLV